MGEMPEDVVLRKAGPDSYSPTDPGPVRAPITQWLHARLGEVRLQTEAGAAGWHALLSRRVTPARKQPLKVQRDKLRRTHPAVEGWRFRVLLEVKGGERVHTLWAHYDPKVGAGGMGGSGGPPQKRPATGESGPAPARPPQRLAPPPAPHPAALRTGQASPTAQQPRGTTLPPALAGVADWAGDDDGMPLREVEE